MKHFSSLAMLVGSACLWLGASGGTAIADEGVALAIVYDTSGSMRESVPDRSGQATPKYRIANRALIEVTRQLEAFAKQGTDAGARKLETGLFVFKGDHPSEALKFGPFNAAALTNWARAFSRPNGNTPLGESLQVASRAVLNSRLPRKHVLVITDGLNTAGPRPESALPQLKESATAKDASLSVHFVAFDVDAKQFSPLKQQGATVVGAADEAQLNSQLQFILQEKILLEEEETPKAK